MTISPDDYVSRDQHEIFAKDISDRIEELKRTVREAEEEPFLEDEEELAALIDFRDRVQAETGNHFDEATIVPEPQFQDHARDWAYSLGDFDFLGPYVDWAGFADDLKGERYTEMDFGDKIVYVR